MTAEQMSAVTVKVQGTALAAALADDLIDARVEQSVQLPDRFTLRFRDPHFQLFDDKFFAMGKTVDIAFKGQAGEAVVTKAEVTGMTLEQGAGDRHELVVTGLDRGHRLARGTEVQTYANLTDSDVATQIARRFGLTATVDATSARHEYLLQYGTAHQFLTERARRIGYGWWVSDRTLFFKKQPGAAGAVKLTWGENLERLKVRMSATELADDVAVRGWDSSTQKVVSGKAPIPSDLYAVGSDAPMAAALVGIAAGSGAFTGQRFTGAKPVADPAEADALAVALALRAAGEQFLARGQAIGNPLMTAGSKVTLDGVGNGLAGTYALATVEHVVGVGQAYVTRFSTGGCQPRALPDLLGGGSDSRWGRNGLVVGLVTNISDPEGYGRIKVKFPTLSDDDESAWARVVGVGAGKSRGFQVPFEVNDEVLVGFEHGDLRRPLILGGLWSGRNVTPRTSKVASDGQGNIQAVWQTKAGHIVEMREGTAPADNHILISLAGSKTKVRIGGDGITVTTPNKFEVTADAGITLTTKGDIVADATNITLKARAKVAVNGAQVDAAATGPLKLAGAMAEMKGSGTARVEGGGIAEVKGGLLKLN